MRNPQFLKDLKQENESCATGIKTWPVVEACLSIHSVAGLLGVFPLPYGILTACFPAVLTALLVGRALMALGFRNHPGRPVFTFDISCYISDTSQYFSTHTHTYIYIYRIYIYTYTDAYISVCTDIHR